MSKRSWFICLFIFTSLDFFVSPGANSAVPVTSEKKTSPGSLHNSASVLLAYFSAPESPEARSEVSTGFSALVNGGQWQAAAGSEFVKLVVVFREALPLIRVSVESCSGDFQDGANFYFDPGLRYGYSEGGRKIVSFSPSKDERGVRALTINFRHTVAPCIKNLILMDKDGNPLRLSAPKSVAATISGWPKTIDRLFDSKSETTVNFSVPGLSVGKAPAPTPTTKSADETSDKASDKSSSHAGVQPFVIVNFAEPQIIDRILVWYGDQSSSRTFESVPRLVRVMLSGGDNKGEMLSLKPLAGVQEARLQSPIHATRVTIKPLDSGTLSEIEFGGAGEVIIPFLPSQSSDFALAFTASGVEKVLEHELATHAEKDNWLFRFRSDGTFFVYGFDDGSRGARKFSGLGTYQVLSAEKNKIKLSLSGTRRGTAAAWDGYVCELACNEPEGRDLARITDAVLIEKTGTAYMVRNRTAPQKRTLPFSDMRTKISTLAE